MTAATGVDLFAVSVCVFYSYLWFYKSFKNQTMAECLVAPLSPSPHTSKADALVEISPLLRLSSWRPGGDAGKRLVIFNLHTAVTGSSELSADVIRAWGPLRPPGAWEDFSLSGDLLYHCSSAMMNVGRHFSVHVCVCPAEAGKFLHVFWY